MPGLFEGFSAGTTLISYTVSNACGTSTSTATVTVNSLPAITGNAPVCVGSAITLSIASTGVWSSTSTNISIGSSTGIVTGEHAGAATVTFTSGPCIETVVVVVSDPPEITGTPVCVGNTATLTATVGGGSWSSTDASIATVTAIDATNASVTGLLPGTVVISYTGICPASYVLTVNAPPAAPATVSVCTDAPVSITAVPGTGAWTGGSSAITVTDMGSGTATVAAVMAGTATLTYTDGNGCQATTAAVVYCPCAALDSAATTLTSTVDYGEGCKFTCTATTSTINGWTMAGYLWQVGSNPPIWNPSTANSDNQSVGVSYSGTEVVTVTFYAVDSTGDTCKQTRTLNLSCERQPCVDRHDFEVTSATDADGNCIFTATVAVSTTHTILGYEWTSTGSPAVVNHTSASSDTYTFTVSAGTSATVSVIVHIVDPYFAAGTSPCCDVTYSQWVSCGDSITKPCACFRPAVRISYTMLDPKECTGKNVGNVGDASSAAGIGDAGGLVLTQQDNTSTNVGASGLDSSIVITHQGKGCCFNVSAAGLVSRSCRIAEYKWLIDGVLVWDDPTSAATDMHTISVPYSGASIEVIIVAIDQYGQKCVFDSTFKLSCSCNCFNDSATVLTAAQASIKDCDLKPSVAASSSSLAVDASGSSSSSTSTNASLGCCYNVTAVAGLNNGCTIQYYQWDVDGIISTVSTSAISSTIPVYVTPGGSSTIIVTIVAIDASGQRCDITKELVLTCGCKCFDESATTITQSPSPKMPPVGCAKIVTVNAGLIQPCKIVSYTWQATGVLPLTVYTSATTLSHVFTVAPASSISVTVTIKAVDDHNDTCTLIKTIAVSCDGKDYGCCFDQSASTLVGGLASPPVDGAGNCLFQFTANYAFLTNSKCRFLGYIWQLGSYPPTGIISLSTVNMSVPPGSVPSATVTFVALSATGDTCKYTQTLSFKTCVKLHAKSGENTGNNQVGNGGIVIFPNPTDGEVAISSDNVDIRTVQVFDVNGKKVGDYMYENARKVNVSLSKLVPGAYLLRINDTVSKVVTKIH